MKIKYIVELASDEALFLKFFPYFLRKNSYLYTQPSNNLADEFKNGVKYLNQDINVYFNTLIKKYRYDFVRAVILHASIIKQSWADADTFKKIKNILSYLEINKIYVYPSNIVGSIKDPDTRKQVLRNIEQLAPILSIHTDLAIMDMLIDNRGPLCGYTAEKVYLFDSKNQKPKFVEMSIFSSPNSIPLNEPLTQRDINRISTILNNRK